MGRPCQARRTWLSVVCVCVKADKCLYVHGTVVHDKGHLVLWLFRYVKADKCPDVQGTVVRGTNNMVLGLVYMCEGKKNCLYVHETVVHGTENMVLVLFNSVKAEKCPHVHETVVHCTENMIPGLYSEREQCRSNNRAVQGNRE